MNSTGFDAGPRYASSVRGGAVLVSLYSWTCITLLGAAARFIMGSVHRVGFCLDDGMVLMGVIVYTGATVASHYAVNGGLGKHFSEISDDDAMLFFKSSYASVFLHLVTMACGKLSSACLVRRVAPQSRCQDYALFGTIGLWTVFSLFAYAFQCGASIPGEHIASQCGHGGPLFTIIALNMISDVILAVWIFPTLRTLNMDRTRRITVGILFGARLSVVLVCIAQTWALTIVIHGDDVTWDSYALAVTSQAVTSLSLIVASLPRIKRFIGVASGMSRPIIDETEIALAARAQSARPNSSAGNEPLKLVPSNSGNFTTTVVSGKRSKDKHKSQGDWQKFVSMGSKQDDHTSTSSLFDHQAGVTMQQEVTVKVEDCETSDFWTETDRRAVGQHKD